VQSKTVNWRQAGVKAEPDTQWAPLKLVIPTEVHHKLMAYVLLCPVEINGWGMIHREPDERNADVITITDVYITKQTVTAAHAIADAAGTAKLITDIIQSGGDASNLRVQWHSHVDMPAYFSATDEHTINTIDRSESFAKWKYSSIPVLSTPT
jgi:hypothetical protein